MSAVRCIRAEGGPFLRGTQFGQACGDLIAKYPAILLSQINDDPDSLHGQVAQGNASRERVTLEVLRRRAEAALPALRARVPGFVEEMMGIAAGARLPLADVLIVNLRGELVRESPFVDAACTAVAVTGEATAGGTTLVGQNLDGEPRLRDLLVILHLIPADGHQVIMLTYAGLIGYHGLGERIAAAATAASVGTWSDGLPHYPYKRLMLQQPTVAAAVQVAERYPFRSSGNYVAGDADGGVVGLEIAPDAAPVRLDPDCGCVVHTNHFLSETLAPRDALLPQFPDSPQRLEQARSMLRASQGRITQEVVEGVLRSHTCGPASICRHDDLETIGSFIADPGSGTVRVTIGSPCLTDYETLSLA